jgi:hypothetical protein
LGETIIAGLLTTSELFYLIGEKIDWLNRDYLVERFTDIQGFTAVEENSVGFVVSL